MKTKKRKNKEGLLPCKYCGHYPANTAPKGYYRYECINLNCPLRIAERLGFTLVKSDIKQSNPYHLLKNGLPKYAFPTLKRFREWLKERNNL